MNKTNKSIKIFFFCAALLIGFNQPCVSQVASLPELVQLSFLSSETKTLPGTSQEIVGSNPNVTEEDKLGNLAAVSLYYQNYSYTDGRYNHNDFKAEKGLLKDKSGKISLEAYKVYGPAKKATEFLGSQHCIYYKFPTKEDYTVYGLEGDKLSKVAEIKTADIAIGQYTKIKELTISNLNGDKTFAFVPSTQKISVYTSFSATVEGAKIADTKLGSILKYKHLVNAIPFDVTIPTWYNNKTRQFFPFKEKDNQASLLWQDTKSLDIYLSIFSEDLKSQKMVKMPNEGGILIAGINSPEGNYYYLCLKKGAGENSPSNGFTIYKANQSGTLVSINALDSSPGALNIYNFSLNTMDMAALEYQAGQLFLMISRTMHKSPDGLNHQGAIALTLDGVSLAVIRNFGQTSGHSFDNYLTKTKTGEFLGVDLGDCYPRGINVHKLKGDDIFSRVIYTAKTEHSSDKRGSFPVYSEISSSGKTYYKWANDNDTYTELGGISELGDGFAMVFSGEPSPSGKSLDNSRAGYQSPDPKNIGFIKIRKDFENSTDAYMTINDDLVLTKSTSEEGGFYDYGGQWNKQRNTGVIWLTKYTDKASFNISHIKSAVLKDGNVLILWENQKGDAYENTYCMKVDSNGKILTAPFQLGSHVRLDRRNNILSLADKIIIFTGNSVEKKLELVVLNF